jgi:hypothetical protein
VPFPSKAMDVNLENLKTRIQAFLPKIDAANKKLRSEIAVTKEGNDTLLDANLIQYDHEDEDEDEVEDDDDDDKDNDDKDENYDEDNQNNMSSKKNQTIELKFQISDMSQNEDIFSLLYARDETDQNELVSEAERRFENDPNDQPMKKPKILIKEIN